MGPTRDFVLYLQYSRKPLKGFKHGEWHAVVVLKRMQWEKPLVMVAVWSELLAWTFLWITIMKSGQIFLKQWFKGPGKWLKTDWSWRKVCLLLKNCSCKRWESWWYSQALMSMAGRKPQTHHLRLQRIEVRAIKAAGNLRGKFWKSDIGEGLRLKI